MTSRHSILVAGDASANLVMSGLEGHPPAQERFCLAVPGGVHLLYSVLEAAMERAGLQDGNPPKPPKPTVYPPYPKSDPTLSNGIPVLALELVRKKVDEKKLGPLGLKGVLGRYPRVPPVGAPPVATGGADLLVICHTEDGNNGRTDDHSAMRSEPWWGDLHTTPAGAAVLFTCHPASVRATWGFLKSNPANRRIIVVTPAASLRASGCLINPLSWEGALIDIYRDSRSGCPSKVMAKLALAAELIITLGPYAAIRCRFEGAGEPEERLKTATFSLVGCLDQAYGSHEHVLTNPGFAAVQAAGIAAHLALTWTPGRPLNDLVEAAVRQGIRYCHRHVMAGFLGDDLDEAPPPVPTSGRDASHRWCQSVVKPTTDDDVSPREFTVGPKTPNRNWSLLKQACEPVTFIEDCVDLSCPALTRVLDRLKPPNSLKSAADDLARGLGFPIARFGKWTGVDRAEIEGYQSLKQRISEYIRDRSTVRPLCLAAFGPPGAGKSFGIKQLAKGLADEDVGIDPEVLEYNLAEFTETQGLMLALHRLRDRALGGKVPLLLFDEFDSTFDGRPLGWLKYLLAPMWDGKFRHGELQYNTGRAVFVFVGGTRRTFEEFSSQLRNREFIDAKGPDFVSRLSGHVNVRGVNKIDEHDQLYFVRRAVFLAEKLQHQVEPEVLRALLAIPTYRHGSRSLESLIKMCVPENRWITRSSLPPEHQLDMHVDAKRFRELLDSRAG